MIYTQLGASDLKVSKICLGTMTFGEQNTEQDAFEQLDYALAQGVSFIDTAELYAVPPRPETQGLTETCIGNWLKARGCHLRKWPWRMSTSAPLWPAISSGQRRWRSCKKILPALSLPFQKMCWRP